MKGPRTSSQVLVRGLDGRTRCVQVPGAEVSGLGLKLILESREGIPAGLQRLVSGSRDVPDEAVLRAEADGHLPSCSIVLRLRGGKGGFGSLLRGAGKAGQVTDNFDACRDLSGRRLRHAAREEKIEEWQANAKERELEKLAEEHVKTVERENARLAKGVVDVKELRQTTAQTLEKVQDAVQDGIGAAMKLEAERKRKQKEAQTVESTKRHCMWAIDEDISDSDEDEDEMPGLAPSKSAGSAGASGSGSKGKASPHKEPAAGTGAGGGGAEAAAGGEEGSGAAPEPVDVRKFKSAADLEKSVGADRLKAELGRLGLKCGGTPADRAARLFLLKSTPLAKLDKKHFAPKPKN